MEIRTSTFLCVQENNRRPRRRRRIVWSNIDRAFAAPVTREEDHAAYAATQIIAELFKGAGFDGIAYRSTFDDRGRNIALFDVEAARLINCGLYRVDGIELDFSQQDVPYFVPEAKAKKKVVYRLRCEDRKGWLRRDQPRKRGGTATYRIVEVDHATVYSRRKWAEKAHTEACELYPDTRIELVEAEDRT